MRLVKSTPLKDITVQFNDGRKVPVSVKIIISSIDVYVGRKLGFENKTKPVWHGQEANDGLLTMTGLSDCL